MGNGEDIWMCRHREYSGITRKRGKNARGKKKRGGMTEAKKKKKKEGVKTC